MSERAQAVIIVTCQRDLPINRLTLPHVLAHIAADSYQVIVPDDEARAFRAALPTGVSIIPESLLLAGWTRAHIVEQLPAASKPRVGWYLQQIVKIRALEVLAASCRAIIWDGDTIPLRAPVLTDAAGRIGFYTGTEQHTAYFTTIGTLLGIERVLAGSFIAQCMSVRIRWIHALIGEIESRAGRPWIEALLASLPGNSPSEFSEYETIGTFALRRHPDECFVHDQPWFRFGTSYCGGLDRITPKHLQQLGTMFDFVAFERWDTGIRAFFRSRALLLRHRLGMRSPARIRVDPTLRLAR